jgi:RNA polymerase sigma-70 factor, ECF subfamily
MGDEEVVARILAGEPELFEMLMRRHNQRVYRLIRGVLRNDAETEDVMQDAYVRAYQHLHQFEGRAQFSTWLGRIALHEALARLRRKSRFDSLDELVENNGDGMKFLGSKAATPEQQASQHEWQRLLETSIDSLPLKYRTVIVLRDVEEMSTAETAAALEITEQNVKIRLHRAHALLRKQLFAQIGPGVTEAFPFHLSRCDRVVQAVMARISPRDPVVHA